MQAFGAGRYLQVGVVLQRALLICTLAMLGVLVIWSQLDRLLLLAGMFSLARVLNIPR